MAELHDTRQENGRVAPTGAMTNGSNSASERKTRNIAKLLRDVSDQVLLSCSLVRH
jgi:FMN phosphatase YigB (HAD superfamily)